jgi:hypothetical protein
MTIYNVHIYREMRLKFDGIEADTPEAAAAIARDKPTGDADDLADCNGDDLAALVDVAGDEDFSRSVTIDFESERQRKAGPRLLTALKGTLFALDENREGCGPTKQTAIADAREAVAEAEAAGITRASADIDVDALLAAQRKIAVIWCIEDVQSLRPDLTDDQCWEVLQQADRRHDAEVGINWEVLSCHADMIHGAAPDADEAEEP